MAGGAASRVPAGGVRGVRGARRTDPLPEPRPAAGLGAPEGPERGVPPRGRGGVPAPDQRGGMDSSGKASLRPTRRRAILVVQGNIGNLEKAPRKRGKDVREEILRRYFRLTRQGLWRRRARAPDFVVWPETAFPGILPYAAVERGESGGPGGRSSVPPGPPWSPARGEPTKRSGKKTNSMVFFDRNGGMADRRYDKIRLLVFGEFVPFSDTVSRGSGGGSRGRADFAPGPGPGIRRIAGIRVGPQICYEGLFPDFSREPGGPGGADLRQRHQRLLVRDVRGAVPAPVHDAGPGDRVPPARRPRDQHRHLRRDAGGRDAARPLAAARGVDPPVRNPVPERAAPPPSTRNTDTGSSPRLSGWRRRSSSRRDEGGDKGAPDPAPPAGTVRSTAPRGRRKKPGPPKGAGRFHTWFW